MNKIIIPGLLALSVFMVTRCANSNLSKYENKGEDTIQNNNSGVISTDGQGSTGSVDSTNTQINTDDYFDDNNDRITGTQIFIEKTFLSLDEVNDFYSNMNSENNSSFIIPDYSCQSSYSYYYFFKGTCNGDVYKKNPNDVEYDNYLFGGVIYSLSPSGDKTILYSFDILTNRANYNPNEDIIEYSVDTKVKSNYFGSLKDKSFIKIFFEDGDQSAEYYEEIIFESIKQYSVIKKKVGYLE